MSRGNFIFTTGTNNKTRTGGEFIRLKEVGGPSVDISSLVTDGAELLGQKKHSHHLLGGEPRKEATTGKQ